MFIITPQRHAVGTVMLLSYNVINFFIRSAVLHRRRHLPASSSSAASSLSISASSSSFSVVAFAEKLKIKNVSCLVETVHAVGCGMGVWHGRVLRVLTRVRIDGGLGFNPPVPLFIPLWPPQPLSSCCVADPRSSIFTIRTLVLTNKWNKNQIFKNYLKVGSQCDCLALWWVHSAGWLA